MGQKSNTLTLRTHKEYLNSRKLSLKEFWDSAEFVNTFKRSLEKKGVTVTYSNFNTVAKTSYLALDLFYKTHKLLKYKKKMRKSKGKVTKNNKNSKNFRNNRNNRNTKKNIVNKKKFFWKAYLQRKKTVIKYNKKRVNITKRLNLAVYNVHTKKIRRIKRKLLIKNKQKSNAVKTIFKHLIKNELIILKLKLLNRKLDRRITSRIHEHLMPFKKKLFSRRFNLYFDFIKLSALFMNRRINLNAYATVLGTIFKFLPKYSHSKFFIFTQKVLHKLLSMPTSKLKGIKVKINGKLKGKLRASSITMSVGKIEAQTIAAKVEFSTVHIHTLYGCFGLKMWANYK